jgi:hypothetical protein
MKTIQIGTIHSFRRIASWNSFSVYAKGYKDGSNRLTYIIAREPPVSAYTMPPASVLAEYDNEAAALAAFEWWKMDPLAPCPTRKKRRDDLAQREFDLGPFKTRAELQFDSLRRRLSQ